MRVSELNVSALNVAWNAGQAEMGISWMNTHVLCTGGGGGGDGNLPMLQLKNDCHLFLSKSNWLALSNEQLGLWCFISGQHLVKGTFQQEDVPLPNEVGASSPRTEVHVSPSDAGKVSPPRIHQLLNEKAARRNTEADQKANVFSFCRWCEPCSTLGRATAARNGTALFWQHKLFKRDCC